MTFPSRKLFNVFSSSGLREKNYSHSENKTHKNIQPREVIFFPLFCQFRCLYVCFISSVLSCLLFGKSCCLYVCLFLLFCLAFIFVSLALSVSVCDSFVRLVAFLLFFLQQQKGEKDSVSNHSLSKIASLWGKRQFR